MNSYKELPEGFVAFKTCDAKDDKRFAILFNIAALIIALVIGTGLWFWRFQIIEIDLVEYMTEHFIAIELSLVAFIVSMILYMVLHELTHGVVYKIMTKEKLKFGITLSCAFCGVPNVYVSKKTALLAVLAPFTVFTIIFLPLVFVLPDIWAAMMILLFASHVGGCSGDLYVTFVLLKNKGEILLNDTGPKQTFYRRG